MAAREARNASGREWMMCVDGGEGAERDTRDAASVSGGEAWRTTTQKQPVRSDAQSEDHVLTGHASGVGVLHVRGSEVEPKDIAVMVHKEGDDASGIPVL